MADIPIERRSGGSWWRWVLGLLLVGLAIWLIAGLLDGGDEDVGPDEVGAALDEPVESPVDAQEPSAAGPITDLTTLATAPNWQEFVGRKVQLNDLTVPSVVGDSAFYVTAGNADERVLVVLDGAVQVEEGGVEGRYNVNEGQTISILDGAVERLGDPALRQWGLQGTEAAGEDFYIRVDRLNITAEG